MLVLMKNCARLLKKIDDLYSRLSIIRTSIMGPKILFELQNVRFRGNFYKMRSRGLWPHSKPSPGLAFRIVKVNKGFSTGQSDPFGCLRVKEMAPLHVSQFVA